MKIPIIGPSYQLRIRDVACERTINLRPVIIESSNGKVPTMLENTEGLTSFADLNDATFTQPPTVPPEPPPPTEPTGRYFAFGGLTDTTPITSDDGAHWIVTGGPDAWEVAALGHKALFASAASAEVSELTLSDGLGSNVQVFTTTAQTGAYAPQSANGRVYFEVDHEDGSVDYARLEADGSTITPVTFDSTGTLRRLTYGGGAYLCNVAHFWSSTDGDTFAMLPNVGSDPPLLGERPSYLETFDRFATRGQAGTVHSRQISSPDWTSVSPAGSQLVSRLLGDGRATLVFAAQVDSDLVVYRSDDGGTTWTSAHTVAGADFSSTFTLALYVFGFPLGIDFSPRYAGRFAIPYTISGALRLLSSADGIVWTDGALPGEGQLWGAFGKVFIANPTGGVWQSDDFETFTLMASTLHPSGDPVPNTRFVVFIPT